MCCPWDGQAAYAFDKIGASNRYGNAARFKKGRRVNQGDFR
jgi:hypothetical protein